MTLTERVKENTTYKTLVSDSLGHQLALQVKVGSKPKASATSTASPSMRKAQEALKSRGFDPGPIDGVLGPRTKAAIRAFQRSLGVNETGTLDEQTKTKLAVD